MRTTLLLLLASLCVLAGEEQQIAWVGDWEAAFKQAKTENKPVMVCINSLDKEQANRRAATGTYRDAAFVRATRDFVMIVVSIEHHVSQGACPRFGKVSCTDHQTCYKELKSRHGETFYSKGAQGDMISPQHAWFRPDGTLLRRKEYELTKPQLLERMSAALKDATGKEATPEAAEPEGGSDDDRKAPLDDKDNAELKRAQIPGKGDAQTEGRRAALANLLGTEKIAARQAVIGLLPRTKPEVKCDILRALGEAQVVEALEAIYERLTKDKDEVVRSFAAVAIEHLGQAESIPVLIKRAKKEKNTRARKNIYRALGVCGGGAKDKEAAKALLKAIRADKQEVVRKGAALGCVSFRGDEASKLVVSKLESYVVKIKTDGVRGAVIYALAYIGNQDTTLPLFEKIRDDYKKSKNRWRLAFIRSAIQILKGEGGDFGRSTFWLFRDDREDPARQ